MSEKDLYDDIDVIRRQLDRIEATVNDIANTLETRSFFGGVLLIIILGMIWKF